MCKILRVIIEVLPYDPQWPIFFEAEAFALKTVFSPLPVFCHHIGSTSVEDLSAKPILDIILTVPFINDVLSKKSQLLTLGFEWRGESGICRRQFFTRRDKGTIDANLHVLEEDDLCVRRHLAFRDFMRKNKKAADDYASVKKKAAARFPSDLGSYYQAKAPTVKKYEIQASMGTGPISPSCFSQSRSFTKEDFQEALFHNFHMHFCCFGWYSPHVKLVSQPGDATVFVADTPDSAWNCALNARFDDENLETRVEEICDFFSHRKAQFSWWISPLDTPKQDLGRYLSKCGFEKRTTLSMLLVPSGPSSPVEATQIDAYEGLVATFSADFELYRVGGGIASVVFFAGLAGARWLVPGDNSAALCALAMQRAHEAHYPFAAAFLPLGPPIAPFSSRGQIVEFISGT